MKDATYQLLIDAGFQEAELEKAIGEGKTTEQILQQAIADGVIEPEPKTLREVIRGIVSEIVDEAAKPFLTTKKDYIEGKIDELFDAVDAGMAEREVHRDAKNGLMVTAEYAAAHPDSTIKQTIKYIPRS